jgi:hypothetical protein
VKNTESTNVHKNKNRQAITLKKLEADHKRSALV